MRAYARIIALTAALACAAACGSENDNHGDPFPVRVVEGVYDATVGNSTVAMTGIVFARDPEGVSIRLELGNDASASFGGTLGADGSLTGPGTLQITDIVFQSTGEAIFSEDAGVAIITGSVTTPSADAPGFEHVTFTMRRSRDADARSFSGTYRVTLTPSPGACACTSTVDLALTFEASGITSTIGSAVERAADGAALGELVGVSGSISPQGMLRVTASYETAAAPVPVAGIVALIGVVDSLSGATAAGETFAGFTPANRVGTWTAERIE